MLPRLDGSTTCPLGRVLPRLVRVDRREIHRWSGSFLGIDGITARTCNASIVVRFFFVSFVGRVLEWMGCSTSFSPRVTVLRVRWIPHLPFVSSLVPTFLLLFVPSRRVFGEVPSLVRVPRLVPKGQGWFLSLPFGPVSLFVSKGRSSPIPRGRDRPRDTQRERQRWRRVWERVDERWEG